MSEIPQDGPKEALETTSQTLTPYEISLAQFPSREDWEDLQGGMPRVFFKAHNPKKRWIVLHVYDMYGDLGRRFTSGIIVDTLPPSKLELSKLEIQKKDRDTGRLTSRSFVVPSFMNRNIHGDLCEDRSTGSGGDTYKSIKTQSSYQGYLAELHQDGFSELIFRVNPEGGYLLQPQPIRKARPLDTAT